MSAPRMPEDIRNQAASLAGILEYQFGAGRPALMAAAARLQAAARIVVSGMGASHFAGLPLASALRGQARAVSSIDSAELLYYDRRACEGAVVVLISRSGASVEVVKLIPALRESGAFIIGVTNEVDSQLGREADEVLLLNSRPDEMVAVQTYTGALLAMLLLGAAAGGRLDDELRRASETAIQAADAAAEQFLAESLAWREFFDGAPLTYLIARGPSLASAYEGALLFNETAKLPSAAMSAGAFRHGPVEVVDGNFRGLIFAGQTATRELDLKLASDLRGLGAAVQTIGPQGDWSIPPVAEMLLPLVEIVPVQIAALRAAEWRGIRPGDFRYVSQVTTSETGFKNSR